MKKLLPKITAYFESFINRGDFGLKTGKGFYSYPAPSYAQAEFLNSADNDPEIFHALVRALIQSAVLVAVKDVADPEDIDRTWMVGTGQDIGPFGLLKQIGVDEFLAFSEKLPEQLNLISAEENELVEGYISHL